MWRKGRKKRYIACNTPRPGEEDFHTVMERLKEEAGRRAGIAQRKQLQEEEQKRLKRLEEIRDALPFRMGMKWGLKLGNVSLCLPNTGKILPPVGYYCAYEEKRLPMGNNGSGRKSGGGGQIPEGGYRMQRYGASDGDSG